MTISSGAWHPPPVDRGWRPWCYFCTLFLLNFAVNRLLDIVHADQKLYLVFEFLDVDLKRYMEAGNSQGTPLSLELCQVRIIQSLSSSLWISLPPTALFGRGLHSRNDDASYLAPLTPERSALAWSPRLICHNFDFESSESMGAHGAYIT